MINDHISVYTVLIPEESGNRMREFKILRQLLPFKSWYYPLGLNMDRRYDTLPVIICKYPIYDNQ